MNETRAKHYKALFLRASVYDVVLGIVFTLFYKSAFEPLGIPGRFGKRTLVDIRGDLQREGVP